MKPCSLAENLADVQEKDRFADLGKPEKIGRVFTGFQKHLYPGGA